MKVLLVLGCQIVYCPDLRRFIPGPVLEKRLEKAIEALLQIGEDCIIIVSGGATHSRDVTESEVMKHYLVERSVPGYKIFEENKSRNTVENCIESFKLIESMKGQLCYQEVTSSNPYCNYYGVDRFDFVRNFEQIIVVSSDFHIPRVQKIFEFFNREHTLAFLSSETPPEFLPIYLAKERLIDINRMMSRYN